VLPIAKGKSVVEVKIRQNASLRADYDRSTWREYSQVYPENFKHYRLHYEPNATDGDDTQEPRV